MNNSKKIDWGFLFIFLLVPLYSLPKVFDRAKKCDKAGIIALCLFFGILAFLIVPNYDATNHGHWAWTTFQNGLFWDYNSDNNDWYLVSLEYLILSLGLQYHYVIFLTVLFSAFPFWLMYYQIAKDETSGNKKKIFVISLILTCICKSTGKSSSLPTVLVFSVIILFIFTILNVLFPPIITLSQSI